MPKPSSIFPGPSRSEVFCPGTVHTVKATPIVPTIPATRRASAVTSARGRPSAAAAPATYQTPRKQNNKYRRTTITQFKSRTMLE